jgi:hypothetical protein
MSLCKSRPKRSPTFFVRINTEILLWKKYLKNLRYFFNSKKQPKIINCPILVTLKVASASSFYSN